MFVFTLYSYWFANHGVDSFDGCRFHCVHLNGLLLLDTVHHNLLSLIQLHYRPIYTLKEFSEQFKETA